MKGLELKTITVPKKSLSATDIDSIGTAVTTDDVTTVTITLKEGVPATALDSVEITADHGVTTSHSGTTVTLSDIPAATWEEQKIKLTIGNNLMYKDVMTIAPKNLSAEDIESIDNAVTTDAGTTVTITLKDGVPTSALASASVSAALKAGDETVTPNPVTATLNGNVVTLTGIPDANWKTQTITLTVGNNLATKTVKTIAAKTISAGDVGITIKDNGTTVTEYPTGEGQGLWYITLTFTMPDTAVTLTDVTYGGTSINSANGWVIDGNGTAIPKTAKITIITSNGTLEDVALFPEGNSNIGSRAAFGGFKQTSASDIAVAGDAPKTRSISLRNWVADLFGGDSEAVDLAAGDAAPLTKKEAKKAKKAAKKAAKAAGTLKAAESSAQPAAELEDLVVAAAEAAGQALDTAVSEDEAAAKPAQIEAEASAPVMSGLEPAAGEASAEEAAPSKAALFLAMAVFCAAIAGIIIFCLKKKPAKK